MRANIKNRGEFIKYAIRNGANAIACSPELVKEGVDLVITPTIIWYGGIWNNYVMAQASYRAFRFHQKHDCEVWFVGYADTD